jgi:CRISPR-associated exonuclease Cas4
MLYDEDDCLPLSGIQHFSFCPRQFALIHIERVWVENILTFEGRVMHDRADDPFFTESRGTVLISRSVPLLSRKLGLYGVADVVEFHLVERDGITLDGREGYWRPYPVEYKRGHAKPDDRDMVQLCAQAMCLEEMLHTQVSEGALFYGKTRRRQTVQIDETLKRRAEDLAQGMHTQYALGETPPPRRTKGCDRCSLKDLCLPKVCARKSVRRYVGAMKAQMDRGEEAP